MYLSYMACSYTVVTVCMMLSVATTALADGADGSVIVEQTIKPERNKETAIKSTSDTQTEKMSENEKIIMAKLKKLFNFTLVGTVLSDTGKPVAIIEDNRINEQKFYRLNDWIRGGRIIKIMKDKVVLTKDGVDVEVKLNTGASRGKGAPVIEKRDSSMDNNVNAAGTKSAKVEEYDSGFPKIELNDLEELSHAPEFSLPVTPLDSGGVKVDAVPADGLLNTLGLETGDIVLNINGWKTGADVSFSEAVAGALQQVDGKTVLRIELKDKDPLYLEVDDSSDE